MKKVLTIVIPSYNVANDLKENLPSILNISKANQEKLEVLIVNDGSQDNTAEVANEFVTKYPTVVKLINKVNGGHGSTINVGIQEAVGTYFKVIDGDDQVETDHFDALISYLSSQTVDMVISPYIKRFIKTEKDEIYSYPSLQDQQIYDINEYLSLTRTIPHMHSIVYRTDILKSNQIKLFEHCFYVDMQYDIFPLIYIQSVAYFEPEIYIYHLGDDNQSVSAQSYLKNKAMHIRVIKSLVDFVNQHRQISNQLLIELIDKKIAELVSVQINIFLTMNQGDQGKEEFLEFRAYLAENHKHSLEFPFGKKAKLLEISSLFFRPLSFVHRQRLK